MPHTQAGLFYYSLGNVSAYNLPSTARKKWQNQYAIGYIFEDGSRFVHYYKGIGVHKNTSDGVTYFHWCTISYGDVNGIWAVKTLKYAIL